MTNSEEIKFIKEKDIEWNNFYWCINHSPIKKVEDGDCPDRFGSKHLYIRYFKRYAKTMEFTDKEVPSKGFASFSDAPKRNGWQVVSEALQKDIPKPPEPTCGDDTDLAFEALKMRAPWRNGEDVTDQTSPDYYTLPNGMQAREALQFFDYNTGCAIKYLWRHGKKEGEDPIKDLNKAKDYIDFRIEYIKKFGV